MEDRIRLQKPPRLGIIVPRTGVVQPGLGIKLPSSERVRVAVGGLGEGDIIRGIHQPIRAWAGDGHIAEAVVGIALGEEQAALEPMGLRALTIELCIVALELPGTPGTLRELSGGLTGRLFP